METKKVFEETGRLGNEITKLHQRINDVNLKCLEIMNDCPHELVFKYNHNKPRKLLIDGYYFCPACGKLIECIDKEHLKKSPFKNSRIIELKNIAILSTKDNLKLMRTEVYSNFDFYYNHKEEKRKIQSKMETVIKENQTDYEIIPKSLRKVKNK